MIKSSWFYVKFKYAEKVSQYIFPPKGNMPPLLIRWATLATGGSK